MKTYFRMPIPWHTRCGRAPPGSGRAAADQPHRDRAEDQGQRRCLEPGHTLGQIAAKTGIPETSLHRYLTGNVHATEVAS
jgi:hypothetical protein